MNASGKTLDLSVIIITQNEASRLPRCLSSLPPNCEIIIVDSGSDDGTQELARKFGARTFQQPFENYSSQKNFAISKASHTWILSLDADEELSSELRADIIGFAMSGPRPSAIYKMQRRLVFMGKTMRFGRTSDRPARLFPRGLASFQGAIHERLLPSSGQTLAQENFPTSGFILHYSYDNLSDYFIKFNRYTTLMAEDKVARDIGTQSTLILCFRPWVNFLYRYFFRLGFLDGYPGYCWALLGSFYSFIKYAKLKERVYPS